MDVPSVIKELVKNSIDAKCTVVEIELDDHLNKQSFDVRVTDDGFGFNEQILHDVGRRQVFSAFSSNEEFRYGNKGKSLLTIAQITEEMYIESIECNSNVRFYKSINVHKPEISVYRTSRELKDAIHVTGAHGASVVLNKLRFQDVIDAVSLKKDIIKGIIELALINYNVKISIKDTATQNMLYETDGMDTQFEKFEHFLESNQVYSRLRFVSCQKDIVKVELFLCENGISSKNLQFVYFNKSIESDGKWKKVINDLCEKQLKNDLNAKFAVYLSDIRVKNHLDNILVDNVIVNNCIKKCIEQMPQSASKYNASAGSVKVRQRTSQEGLEILNEGNPESERQTNCNERTIQGVRLGDWIFNNSCENEMLDQDGNIYRNKVCENWVLSLEKPKPKDPNDSLQFVEIENMQRDDDKFKKPLGRPIRKSKPSIKAAVTEASQHSPKPFEPSNYIDKFNSPSLMKASRKLIADQGKDLQTKVNMVTSETSFRPVQPSWPNESSFDNVHQGSSRGVAPTAPLCHIPPNNNNLNKTAAFNPPTPNNDISLNDRFQIHRSVQETFDFQFHNSQHNKSNCNIFENNRSSAYTPCHPPPQSQNQANHYQSAIRETSQIHYHHRRRSSSLSTFHGSEMSSRVTKKRRSTSRSSSNSRTGVAPRSNNNKSNGKRNHGIRHGRHQVTININFG